MLELQNISAAYGAKSENPALCEISIRVAAGEILAVIGPNGCGKSTLLRCAAGLLSPMDGRILLDEHDIFQMDLRERARHLALLPQHFEGGGELTVEQMVAIGRTPHLSPYGTLSARDREIVERALHVTDSHALALRRVGELSGGERQRVMLSRALAQEARVLLLDEPTSNLDLRYQFELLALVKRLSREQNLSAIVVLHQINLAAALADAMLLLNEGLAHAQGAPHEVMTQENLTEVFRTPLNVAPHPLSGRPQAQAAFVFG